MDWLLILFGVSVGLLVLTGVLYLIDTAWIELSVGDAVVISRDYNAPYEELDHAWFAATKMWRYKIVPASWYLLLEVCGEQSWIEVTEGTYHQRDGALLKVWFGRRRLTGRILVSDFYNG